MFKNFRRIRDGGNGRWMIIGLIIIAIAVIGWCSFLQPRSVSEAPRPYPEETVRPQPEEDVKLQPEVREFTERKFVRIPAKGIIGGVLAGIAYYLAIPLWLLRLLFLAGIFIGGEKDERLSGFLIVVYLLCYLVVPAIDFIPADFIARAG